MYPSGERVLVTMAYEIVIPRLGLTMENGRVVRWYRQERENVAAGEPLFAVETDKAIQDVEAPVSGTVLHVAGLPAEPLPIGTVIGYIVAAGEGVPLIRTTLAEPAAAAGRESVPASSTVAGTGRSVAGKKLSSPAARCRAEELGIDWRQIERPGGGPILLTHVEQAARSSAPPGALRVSPLARRMAAESGLDLAEVAAGTPSARIRSEDIQAAVAARGVASAQSSSSAIVGKAMPITQMRRIIAQRMTEAAHGTAPVSLTTEADATELVSVREQLKAALLPQGRVVPTFTDLLIKLTAWALQEHPMLNAQWRGDEIVIPQHVHIAVAVDTEAGLLVPVVRHVLSKTIEQIAAEAHSLAERARTRQLGPDELQGGTFTITNLGMFGIDAFTPIINLPQCAVLGVGRISEKPVVWEDEIAVRRMMVLSLTFDHRLVDGGPAARFLNTVREYVENPFLWLLR